MLHYFTQLPKDNDLTFEKNIGVSKAIMHTAQNAFEPFNNYLHTTIKSLDKKEDIKATWSKVKQDNLVELKIIGSLYEVPKTTKIQLLNIEKGIYSIEGKYDKDFDIPLIIWNNKQKIKINLTKENFISKNRIKLDNIYEEIEKANWAGDDVIIKPIWVTVNKNDKISQEKKQFKIRSVNSDIIEVEGILNNSPIFINKKQVDFKIIEISKPPQNTKVIKEEQNRFIVYLENDNKNHNPKLLNLLNKENLKFENGSKFNAEHTENFIFKVEDKSLIGKKVIVMV